MRFGAPRFGITIVVSAWFGLIATASAQNIFDNPSPAAPDDAPPPQEQAVPADQPWTVPQSAPGSTNNAPSPNVMLVPTAPPRNLSAPAVSSGREAEIQGAYVFVNGNDGRQIGQTIELAIDIVKRFGIPVASVTMVGTFVSPPEELYRRIVSTGMSLDFVNQLPPELNAVASPTWVFETNQGKVVLEAPGDVRRFITPEKRLLISRIRSEIAVVSARK